MPQPEVDDLSDLDPTEEVVRRILPDNLAFDPVVGHYVLIPAATFVFNPDLSCHRVAVISTLGSSVDIEYDFPENGAVELPLEELCAVGAGLKETPHALEPILGPAHASVFGIQLPRPSKSEKAMLRDLILEHLCWVAAPVGRTPVG